MSPHRSLDARGFALFIGATFVLLLVPLGPMLGTAILWVMLPFLMAALAMIWIALRASAWRQSVLSATLWLTADCVSLERRGPGATYSGGRRTRTGSPSACIPRAGQWRNYVTPKAAAARSPAERLALHDEIEWLLRRVA